MESRHPPDSAWGHTLKTSGLSAGGGGGRSPKPASDLSASSRAGPQPLPVLVYGRSVFSRRVASPWPHAGCFLLLWDNGRHWRDTGGRRQGQGELVRPLLHPPWAHCWTSMLFSLAQALEGKFHRGLLVCTMISAPDPTCSQHSASRNCILIYLLQQCSHLVS